VERSREEEGLVPVSKRLRYEILRRDNHACRYCGAAAPEAKLTVDHVVPVTLGGSDEPTNLVTACEACNSGKSATPADSPVVADVQADALRWGLAMEQAARITRQTTADRELFAADFKVDIWENWTWDFGKQTFPLPDDWKESVLRFKDAGIGVSDFEYAVETAMHAKADPGRKFRYMCGVLWKMISERQEIAMEIVRGEADNGA
jgi:hypothetical protein